MKNLLLVVIVLFVSSNTQVFSQDVQKKKVSPVYFDVKVRVVNKKNKRSIKDAEVTVNGREFPFQFVKDFYLVNAKSGDQLMVTHPDFETVYYEIKDDEDIKIEIRDFASYNRRKFKSNPYPKKNDRLFLINLDSAKFYKERDLEKSLNFLENALRGSVNSSRNAAAYKTLADVYLYWKQYDLAVKNYAISIRYRRNNEVRILYASSLLMADSLSLAKQEFLSLEKRKLTNYQKVLVYEGLGDLYLKEKNYQQSKSNYYKGLKIAQENLITPKITDLNSKIADVFASEGKIVKANQQYDNSLKLAANENRKRSIQEKEKVANFYNTNRQFDKEIKLRKEALKEADEDSTIVQPSKNQITPQKINYKIGRAYVEKGDSKNAIPFLKKSIETANKKKDLEVKKDATRKISEAYANEGDYGNALKNYQDYVKVVDALYLQKEQEIERAKRLGLKIAEKENRITGLEKDKILSDSKINLALKDQQLSAERNKNQQYIIYSLAGGIALMIFLAYLLYRNNKQQKLANNLLALKSMRSQMNPHFIFNALNSVNSFIAVNDERKANRYLSEFSTLMRSVLENSDEDFIPLAKEIELLELYTKLEHNRFQDKFDYTIQVDKSITLDDFTIPPMLLQPYIENAIWHGLRYKKEKGNLEIELTKIDDESVKIVIQDNGVGRKKSKELKTKNQLKQKSKGMSTIQNRIEILNDMYQDKISVSVSDLFDDETGTKVELFLKKS